MKFWPLAAASLIAAESAAVACSCLNTDDPIELRKLAADAAKDAVAMVEVETIVSFAESKGAGDRMRVVRTLVGSGLPGEFRVARGGFPSSASCDLLFEKGQRDVVLLYAPVSARGEPAFRISGLCTAHLLDKKIFRDEVARLMAARASKGERG
ncbi:MAG TPA: hypothetical protein VGB39_01465 [Sphingomicrobium sp.]